jgi:oligopeptide transport system substrate-binding protein
MVFASWGADYPDPDVWFGPLFRTGGSQNLLQYSNPEADTLMDQAAVELDNDARIALYEDIQRIVIEEDAAVAPLEHQGVFHLVQPLVRRWRLHPLDAQIPGDYGYARVYIAAAD